MDKGLAIDAATSPRERARELRGAWEEFMGLGVGDPPADRGRPAPRGPIAASWRRSQEAKVDPFGNRIAPVVASDTEVASRWDAHPLSAAVPLIRECVSATGGIQHLASVSDAQGVLLWMDGHPRVRLVAADLIAEGTTWNEATAGTNGIGTPLAAGHAVHVFAGEHFNELAQAWSCAGAPIHDPETDALLGVFSITNQLAAAHPHDLMCVVATARAVEGDLRCRMLERDTALRSRYAGLLAAGGRRALLSAGGRVLSESPPNWLGVARMPPPGGAGELRTPSGARVWAEPVGHGHGYLLRAAEDTRARARPVLELRLLGQDRATIRLRGRTLELTRRQTEVLALLALHPSGITSEELASDLYGERAGPGAARAEVSRLGKVLGGMIDSDSYRLAMDVRSDVARVRALLDLGDVRAAVEQYPGPLLPRSEAPGIARNRETLDIWVRHAVMSADDPNALWAWLGCPSGRGDELAWKRLLAQLDFRDPRRSQAAARLRLLREQASLI